MRYEHEEWGTVQVFLLAVERGHVNAFVKQACPTCYDTSWRCPDVVYRDFDPQRHAYQCPQPDEPNVDLWLIHIRDPGDGQGKIISLIDVVPKALEFDNIGLFYVGGHDC